MASVTHNGKQFMLTVGLLTVVIYLYTGSFAVLLTHDVWERSFSKSEYVKQNKSLPSISSVVIIIRVKTVKMTSNVMICWVASNFIYMLVLELVVVSVTSLIHLVTKISIGDLPSILHSSSLSLSSCWLSFRWISRSRCFPTTIIFVISNDLYNDP